MAVCIGKVSGLQGGKAKLRDKGSRDYKQRSTPRKDQAAQLLHHKSMLTNRKQWLSTGVKKGQVAYDIKANRSLAGSRTEVGKKRT